MARKKPTKAQKKLQQEYKRELKNLKERLRYYEKRGLIHTSKVDLPKPERITKGDIAALQELRGQDLIQAVELTWYDVDRETGELRLSPDLLRWKEDKEERENFARSTEIEPLPPIDTYQTEVDGFLYQLESAYEYYTRPQAKGNIQAIIDTIKSVVNEAGVEAAAKGLREASYNGVQLEFEIPYSDDKAKAYILELIDYITPHSYTNEINNIRDWVAQDLSNDSFQEPL